MDWLLNLIPASMTPLYVAAVGVLAIALAVIAVRRRFRFRAILFVAMVGIASLSLCAFWDLFLGNQKMAFHGRVSDGKSGGVAGLRVTGRYGFERWLQIPAPFTGSRGGGTVSTTTGADGSLSFTGLRGTHIEIQIELPKGLELHNLGAAYRTNFMARDMPDRPGIAYRYHVEPAGTYRNRYGDGTRSMRPHAPPSQMDAPRIDPPLDQQQR